MPSSRSLVSLGLLVATASFAVVAPVSSARNAAGYRGFRTPSKNIYCTYFPRDSYSTAVLRCDMLSGLKPEPKTSCDLDWTGASLSLTGKGQADCAGDFAGMPNARVLAYGKTWSYAGFTCRSRFNGLTCTNRAGHGLFLSRERWRVF